MKLALNSRQGGASAPPFPFHLGLSHKCSVVTEMAEGMKMMGEYDTKEAAEAAMATMDECKG